VGALVTAAPDRVAPRRSLHDLLRRLLLVVGAVLLLTLGFALVALARSLRLLEGGPDPAPLDAVRQWNHVLLWVILVLVLLVIGMGLFVWRALRHGVTEPLARLASAVRAASTGSHEHEIPVEGSGEVAALAADVEHMRRELVQQVEQLRESHAETERAHELLRAQTRELERSNRDLEQFAYVASHDLQEPLRKVASFTQLLQKRYGGQLDERADQYIGFAVDGARRMQRLIQDLLSFSRVGRSGAVPVDVDLEAVLAQVLRDLDERIADAGAVVTHDPLPVVRGERALLAMLLTNVVSNAVKFRHPERTASVHLSARREGDHWEISCADNGIGIDPQYAERVFVIFQRLHPKEVYTGTGIGLALVKRVVEHHGGRVWIEPSDGGGTTVRWTLQAAGGSVVG
jgi:signal transduction histidine kinase